MKEIGIRRSNMLRQAREVEMEEVKSKVKKHIAELFEMKISE